MKRPKALHFCALQPNAKQWNHQSRLRSPVGTTGCNKGFSQFGLHVYKICVLLSNLLESVGIFCLTGQFLLVFGGLPSSIIARASNKTLVAKPSRTKCKGVRPWRSPQCAKKNMNFNSEVGFTSSFKYMLCIYGAYLSLIYQICI